MPKRNDIIEVKIDTLEFPNKGLGNFDGYRAVVKNTIPGQEVIARVAKKKNGSLECRLMEVKEKAEYEINSVCPHFELCGGCSYQNIPVDKENEIKAAQVLTLLKKAGIRDFVFEGIETSPVIEGYRNKCEFSFGDTEKGGMLALGMRKRQSHYEVVNLTDCNLVDEDYLKIIKASVEYFREKGTPFYHKARHDGCLRHLVIRKGAYTGEILVNLITANEMNFDLKEFADKILSLNLDGKICSVLHTQNDSLGDVVKSDKTTILFGNDYFTERLFDLEFKVTAFSFFQTNTKGAEILYSIVKEYAGDSSEKTVFDLYCGTGTIGQIMAEKSRKVIGIEIVEEAVAAANDNSERNGINNCVFIAGDVLKKVDELDEKPDIIIVDPPREGIHPKAINKIIDFGADRVVYVSCKPSSLAKDLTVFEENGYKVEKVKCVNQFPRTVHVETIVLLQKKELTRDIEK